MIRQPQYQQQSGVSIMMNPSSQVPGIVKKPNVPGSGKPVAGKLMRLRCRLRPLHDVCLSTDSISDKGCDVVFICTGGEQVRAHKIILSMASKFFVQLFKDQKAHKQSYVSLPDVSASIMTSIVLLCYKDRINVSDKTLREIQGYLQMFGLPLSLFNKSETHPEPTGGRKPTTITGIQAGNRVIIPSSTITTTTLASRLTLQGGQIIKTPGGGMKQTLILDCKSNGIDDSSSSDYILKQAQSKPRLILPKPSGSSSQGLYRGTSGPPILKRMSSPSSTPGVSPSDPSIELDKGDDDGDETEPLDALEAKKMMQEWMANIGKTPGAPPKLSKSTSSPVKRKASPIQSTPRLLKGGFDKAARRQCSVCSNVFEDESKWRWHEERHVGLSLFKCTICGQILATARKVYQHEMMEHGIVGTGSDDQNNTATASSSGAASTTTTSTIEKSQPVKSTTNQVKMVGHIDDAGDEGGDEADEEFEEFEEEEDDQDAEKQPERVTVVRTQHGTHYRRLPPTKKKAPVLNVRKLPKPALLKLHKNFAHKNPKIGIGYAEGQESVESKKLKQLHWLYVCTKCECCSDSSTKAISHHRECYKNGEKPFEDSVLKFRQGFYGRVKCPLCPRRYTSLGGFLIHCGHMHNGYRKKFTHINTDDKMVCAHCRNRFDTPEIFHAHLNQHQYCEMTPSKDAEEMMAEQMSQQEPTANQTFEESRQKQYAKLLGTNPRSARLQNRLAAATACGSYEEENVDEETLPPVTCPVCGTASIKNLSVHLGRQHPEIEVKVERFEESTLRCKACSITFATCDLLAHNNSCTGSKGLNYVAQRKAAGTTKIQESPKQPKPKRTLEFPEGIGASPVDTIEARDLMCPDVLRQAFRCQVCKRFGKKMNIIADCLKAHGIYRCAVCFNTYSTKEANSAHLKKCHASTTTGKLICPICKVVRANAGQLVSHMYNNHWLPILKMIDEGAKVDSSKQEGDAEEEDDEEKDETMNSSCSMDTSGEESMEKNKSQDSMEEQPSNDYPDLTLTELLKTSESIDKIKTKDDSEKILTTEKVDKEDTNNKEEEDNEEEEEKMDTGDDNNTDEKTVNNDEKLESDDKNESEVLQTSNNNDDEQAA